MYHFHLASVINPTADIALLSTIPTGSVFGKSFQLQWLNNKEIQFTTSYELLTNGYFTSDKQNEDEDSMNDEDYAVLNDMEYDGEMEANEDTIIEDKDDMTRFDGNVALEFNMSSFFIHKTKVILRIALKEDGIFVRTIV